MRLIYVILALLSCLAALILTLLLMDSPAGASGQPHALIDGMSSGGDGLARLGGVGFLMALMQCLTLILIHALVALGVAAQHRSRQFWLLLSLGCLSSLGIWWGLYTSYVGFLNSGSSEFVFGFPLSTALMLFGVFSSGIYLCGLYIWGFRRFIYTPDDEAAYELLRAAAAAGRRSETQARGSKF